MDKFFNSYRKLFGNNRGLRNLARKVINKYDNIYKKYRTKNRIEYVRKFVTKYFKGQPQGNVILIVIDSLRYRNLSFTGYYRQTTPFMDTFENKLKAYSAAPHTYSSVPSILTGKYPHNHGAYIGGFVKHMDLLRNYRPLKTTIVTLPEILKVKGYEILFMTSIYPSVLPFKRNAFEYKDLGDINSDMILKSALKQILKYVNISKKVFAYIHIGDLHGPINPPFKYYNFFGIVKNLPYIDTWAYKNWHEQRGKEFEDYKYNRILLYDNTLRYVDEALKNFVLELEEATRDPLLLIITADHGDEFWEHADIEYRYFYDPRGYCGVGHGHNLFNEIIEVPLLFKEFNTRNVIKTHNYNDSLISTVDILPTILDWLGLDFKRDMFDGYPLSEIPKNRWILSEAIAYGYEKKVMIRDRYKLLYSGGDNISWVFDLKKDYNEYYPIVEDQLVSEMVKELKRILARDILYSSIKFQ